ncbi:MAG: alpha/beta hydrolase [Nitriliruptorales bacterium]|nr:alpha/beta hydrolase [Nitriliruptorales bacterium]
MAERPRTVVERAGVTLVAERHGRDDAPGVLLSHGVASSNWFPEEALVGPFLDAGYRVELMGLPGHEPSSPCTDVHRYALDEVAADLGAMAAATGCRVVGGVSLAAHAAARLAGAGTDRVDALVLCLPAWVGRATPGEGVHARIADEVRTLGVPLMLERLRADRTMAPWLQHTLPRDWARHDPDSIGAALRSLDGGDAPTAEELASIEAPVAIVTWPDDPGHPIEAARRWHELVPNSALRETSIEDMQHDRTLLGQLALDALKELGVDARHTH